jgi:hypothetical protein
MPGRMMGLLSVITSLVALGGVPNKSLATWQSPQEVLGTFVSSPSRNFDQQPQVDDSDLIRAVRDRRDVFFIEAKGVLVTRILPTDTQSRLHQKWFIRLSNGASVFCAYNISIATPVPIEVGDVVDLAGEFKWTEKGPLMHWLHIDPRRKRPDGFVFLEGKKYGHRK